MRIRRNSEIKHSGIKRLKKIVKKKKKIDRIGEHNSIHTFCLHDYIQFFCTICFFFFFFTKFWFFVSSRIEWNTFLGSQSRTPFNLFDTMPFVFPLPSGLPSLALTVTLNLLGSKHSLAHATKLRRDGAQQRGRGKGRGWRGKRERRRTFFSRLSRKSLSHESRPRLGTEGRERERAMRRRRTTSARSSCRIRIGRAWSAGTP